MTGIAGAPAPSRQGLGSGQVIFLATMVALDFAFGWLAKPLMQALGLATFLHVEMIPPVMLILLSRLTLDRFGVLLAYEAAWALIAMVAMPGGVLPGPLKLVPLLITGLVMDGAFSACRRWGTGRIALASVLGGLAGALCQGGLRILLGLPWARSTQVYIGFQLLGGVAVHAAGAFLAVLVWRRVQEHPALQGLKVGP
jgi:hypothetical protein